jgi:hypothetical protein
MTPLTLPLVGRVGREAAGVGVEQTNASPAPLGVLRPTPYALKNRNQQAFITPARLGVRA